MPASGQMSATCILDGQKFRRLMLRWTRFAIISTCSYYQDFSNHVQAQMPPRHDRAPSLAGTLVRTLLYSARVATVVSALTHTGQMATGRYCSHEYSHHEK
ncbi:hypothetical protein T440DRAFT_52559 [Plenodomus tracheiphilus IPT5]|uniref:Uncharacterized protein n=1 Tax=Plenodomus tracheiphilus IPT5 TaxID=1408161 RepID=A0A6A7ALW1_9PLEO|nr:hypothetical protein T440DRAFT_52559 [Plenodomus tracheiphilus IPT5]